MRTVTVRFDGEDETLLDILARTAWAENRIDAYTPLRTIIAAGSRAPGAAYWVEFSVTAAETLVGFTTLFPQIQEALEREDARPQRRDRPPVRQSRRFL